MHDEYKNRYSFIKDGRTITLVPLTPAQVYKDQLKLRSEEERRAKELGKMRANSELEKKRENVEIAIREKKREQSQERKERECPK